MNYRKILDIMSTDLRFNKYSQNGEDGILQGLTERIGLSKGYFVEFGAWDGKKYSNCAYLYEKGWKGCFIEANPARFKTLLANYPDDKVLKLNMFIEESGPNSLDSVMVSHGITDVDVLSIDIDSDDLAIWESVTQCLPEILVIEYNPTIPFDTRYKNARGKNHGNAALSILESSEAKGYSLIDGTSTNLIFLRKKTINRIGLLPKNLQELKDQLNLSRYFFGYDGTLLQEKSKLLDVGITELFRVPWSNYIAVQPIPRLLRAYRDSKGVLYYVGLVRSLLFALHRSPVDFLRLFQELAKTRVPEKLERSRFLPPKRP